MFMDNSSIEGKSMDQEQSYLLEIRQQEELHYNIHNNYFLKTENRYF